MLNDFVQEGFRLFMLIKKLITHRHIVEGAGVFTINLHRAFKVSEGTGVVIHFIEQTTDLMGQVVNVVDFKRGVCQVIKA